MASKADNTGFISQYSEIKKSDLNTLFNKIKQVRTSRRWDNLSTSNLSFTDYIEKEGKDPFKTIISALTYNNQSIDYKNSLSVLTNTNNEAVINSINLFFQAANDIANGARCSSGCTVSCTATCSVSYLLIN